MTNGWKPNLCIIFTWPLKLSLRVTDTISFPIRSRVLQSRWNVWVIYHIKKILSKRFCVWRLLVVNRRRQCRVFYCGGWNFVSYCEVRISVPECWIRDLWIGKLFLIDGFISLVTRSFVFLAEFCAHCSFFIILGVFHFSTKFAKGGWSSDLCSGGNRSNLENVNDQPNCVLSCFISVPPNTWYIKDYFHS